MALLIHCLNPPTNRVERVLFLPKPSSVPAPRIPADIKAPLCSGTCSVHWRTERSPPTPWHPSTRWGSVCISSSLGAQLCVPASPASGGRKELPTSPLQQGTGVSGLPGHQERGHGASHCWPSPSSRLARGGAEVHRVGELTHRVQA